MTTFADEKLDAFFGNVVEVVTGKYVKFHWPTHNCFDKLCKAPQSPDPNAPLRSCDWKELRDLAATFWKDGPEVDGIWKRNARYIGLNPDDLHETLLGVFIGGDGGNDRFNLRFFDNMKPKLLHDTGYFSPRPVAKPL